MWNQIKYFLPAAVFLLLVSCYRGDVVTPSTEVIRYSFPYLGVDSEKLKGEYLNYDTNAIIFSYSATTESERSVLVATFVAEKWKPIREIREKGVIKSWYFRTDNIRPSDRRAQVEVLALGYCSNGFVLGRSQFKVRKLPSPEHAINIDRWTRRTFWPVYDAYLEQYCKAE